MNIPSYTPNINATGPYANPGNQYPMTNQAAPPNNYGNYGPQPVYNVMPVQPIQPIQPYQPYQPNNMIPSSNAPLLINQGVNYSLEATECMEDLNGTQEATITKEFEGLIMKDLIYTVSIKGLANRVIFIGKKKSEFFHNNKFFDVKVKYVPRDVEYSVFSKNKDFEKRLFDISSSNEILPGSNIRITNKENGALFGLIKQPNCCCCSDPDFQIINGQNLMKYRGTTDGCQCGYCCCDDCCYAESETQFRILDSTKTQLVGEILKNEYHRGASEKFTYNIRFPIDATPEEKILIISATISIDCLNFRRLGM